MTIKFGKRVISLRLFDETHEFCEKAIKALEQESCEDAISRKSIKQKLQEHHDFFVNAYGGFSNLPQNDKSRVDEITNCIAMVINEPSITPQPKSGHWIQVEDDKCKCSECDVIHFVAMYPHENKNFCPNCGCRMEDLKETKK